MPEARQGHWNKKSEQVFFFPIQRHFDPHLSFLLSSQGTAFQEGACSTHFPPFTLAVLSLWASLGLAVGNHGLSHFQVLTSLHLLDAVLAFIPLVYEQELTGLAWRVGLKVLSKLSKPSSISCTESLRYAVSFVPFLSHLSHLRLLFGICYLS